MTHHFLKAILGVVLLLGVSTWGGGQACRAADGPFGLPVQLPYSAPPKPEPAPDTSVPQNRDPLTPEEIKRAEALLPLLSGPQELWAMGEFVHLGPPVIPVLAKGLKMSNPRIRYNSIETLGMIKDPDAVPALLESAMQPLEMQRVREHALRVSVRLDPSVTTQAIEVMAKDPHESIRKAAAFEARYVREKAVVPVLIELIKDEERFVAVTAVQSLWKLTRHETELHDWVVSTPEEREKWAQEWIDWWEANQDTFEIPEGGASTKPL